MPNIVQSFWYGGQLSPYEVLCMRSFTDRGYEYHLYSYDRTLDTPNGVTLCDATEILPENRVFRIETGLAKGSYALFSDLFRYELLLCRGG
jgi:hypothetical protein